MKWILSIVLAAISLNAHANCTLDVPADVIFPSLHGTSTQTHAYANVSVRCAETTPFQLEITSVSQGGVGELRGVRSNHGIPFHVWRITDRMPVGSIANNEHLSGVGGTTPMHFGLEFRVSLNYRPPVDEYTNSITFRSIY